jgi:CRP/FNR family transcriptional regulator, nitrogen fixation regulation protein
VITVCARTAGHARATECDLISVQKGFKIYHQGDPARHWYEIVSGVVRTCRFHADGHRQLTGFFYADDVFGIDGPLYMEAAESVTCVTLRRHPLRAASFGDGHDIVLGKALESARRSIFLFGHRTAANRIAAFLIAVADRSGPTLNVHLPMTRNDIADHLNLTLHTVSRTMSEFARKRLIALDCPQNVQILDLEGLASLAGETAVSQTPRSPELRVAWTAEPCETL